VAQRGGENTSLAMSVYPNAGLRFLGLAVGSMGEHSRSFVNCLYVIKLPLRRKPTIGQILHDWVVCMLLYLLDRDGCLGTVPLRACSEHLGPCFLLPVLGRNVPVIGMHGAMECQGGLTRLVYVRNGFDECNVRFLREAMI
jgi:hypothetical protein